MVELVQSPEQRAFRPGLNYLCPSFKHFFGHTAPAFRRMAHLVRSGSYADEIMAEVAADPSFRSAP